MLTLKEEKVMLPLNTKISGGKESYYLGKSSCGNEHEISTPMQYSLFGIIAWTQMTRNSKDHDKERTTIKKRPWLKDHQD
jgi:hypothetical protein